MNETMVVSTDKEKKRKCIANNDMTIPVIQRTDIMSGLLSSHLNHYERSRLSNLYAEITYMEKEDLKYINEIAVSSQSDMEVYEMINKMKKIGEEQKN